MAGPSAGYDISASASSSATAGNKSAIGPVAFGGINIGPPPAAGSSQTLLIVVIVAVVAAVAFFLFKRK